MNEEKFEGRLKDRIERHQRRNDKSHIWGGFILLVVGGLLLARELGVFFPSWFFTWPMILIVLGLVTGVKTRFRDRGWLFLLLVGGVFLAGKIDPGLSLYKYLWPILIISAGLFFIFKPKSRYCSSERAGQDNDISGEPVPGEDILRWEKAMDDRKDVIDITAVFGGVKKNMLTKDFKGGDVVAFMGGTEINLTQADFNGRVIIDNFNMFGGTKLIVPPDWDVQSQIVAIFGGVDDKRPPVGNVNPNKVLFLEGTCIFGGVEIKSF
ncbi:MAG TPA: DUF5668 domain-containing protein [Flavisolibacter sp.]|nr:DUF5668 domain-containing protein [Flavisolibacter sp.]